jgi:hypothetical protein
MNPTKCPCCDGYGCRERPTWMPGEGPVECRACGGKGAINVFRFGEPSAPVAPPGEPAPDVIPPPIVVPFVPYEPPTVPPTWPMPFERPWWQMPGVFG